MSSRLDNNVGKIFQGKDNLLKSIASYTRAYNTYQQCTAADGGSALAMSYTPYYGKKVADVTTGLAANYIKTDYTPADNNGTSISTTAIDCQDICNVNKTCYGFTYDTSNNICRLQGSGIARPPSTPTPTVDSYIKKYTSVDCGTMTVSSASFSTDGRFVSESGGSARSLQDLAGNGKTPSFTLYSGVFINKDNNYLAGQPTSIDTKELCQTACYNNANCGGYAHGPISGVNKCYLYNSSVSINGVNGRWLDPQWNSGTKDVGAVNIGAGLNMYAASSGSTTTSGSIAQSAKALYTNIHTLNNMPFSEQSVIDSSYNTMLNQRSSIDIELQNLYNVPNSIPNMYAENWDLTIYMGIIWTILATSLIYYIFTKL